MMSGVIALLAAVLIALGSAPAATAREPQVRLAGVDPIAVRGAGFIPRERVAVTVRTTAATMRLRLTSSKTGRFVARFGRSLPAGTCGEVAIRAVGARGDQAAWKSPPRLCGAQSAP